MIDTLETSSQCTSDVLDSPGSLKDFVVSDTASDDSFAISEQSSPSFDNEDRSSTSRFPAEERSFPDVGHLYRLLANLHEAFGLLQKSVVILEGLVIQQTASAMSAEEKFN